MSASYGVALVTAATGTAVTLSEARRQCGLPEDYAYHDSHLLALINAAQSYVERHTARALISSTWDYTMERFPYGDEPLWLPKSPLASVTSVKYYDADGTQQTWTSSEYVVFTDRQPGCIRLASDAAWPSVGTRPQPVTVRFVAGYLSASAVPADLRACLLLLIEQWFTHRGATEERQQYAVPHAVDALLEAWRVGDEFHCYAGG